MSDQPIMHPEPNATSPVSTTPQSRGPFRVINFDELGIDPFATGRRKLKGREPAGDRLLRIGLILLGLAICILASNLPKGRMKALWSGSSENDADRLAPAKPSVFTPSGASGAQPAARPAPQPAASSARSDAPLTRGADFTLLDWSLAPTAAQITRLEIAPGGRGEVRYLDASGREQRTNLSQVAAIAPSWWSQPASDEEFRVFRAGEHPEGWIELIDGQRWVGVLDRQALPGGEGQEVIAWKCTRLGTVVVPLDHIRRIVLSGSVAPVPSDEQGEVQDVVRMRNGDVLKGFVDSLISDTTPPGSAMLRMDLDKGQSTTLVVSDIAEIRLKNESVPTHGPGAWLDDGSFVRLLAVQPAAQLGRMRVQIARVVEGTTSGLPQSEDDMRLSSDPRASGQLELDFENVLAIVMNSARIVPVASLKLWRQSPSEGRRWSEPARALPLGATMDLNPLDIPGPMVLEWVLPRNAERFSGRLDLPEHLWAWGDCLAVLAVVSSNNPNGSVIAQGQLNAQQPHITINAAIEPAPVDAGPRQLRLTIQPGKFGAIQDRVILSHPTIVVGDATR